jgi:hypothetical protein
MLNVVVKIVVKKEVFCGTYLFIISLPTSITRPHTHISPHTTSYAQHNASEIERPATTAARRRRRVYTPLRPRRRCA